MIDEAVELTRACVKIPSRLRSYSAEDLTSIGDHIPVMGSLALVRAASPFPNVEFGSRQDRLSWDVVFRVRGEAML